MQFCKRIFALTFVVVLIFAITAPCFSIGLALDAVDFWSIGWEMYCSQHGIRNYFTTNGTSNSMSDPAQKSVAQGMWEALYNEYRSYDSNAPLMQNIGQFIYNGLTANYTPIAGSETLYNLIVLSSAIVGHYDAFANWLFGEKMGLIRDASGNFHTGGSFNSPVISSYSSYSANGFVLIPVVGSLTSSNIINNGVNVCTNRSGSAINIAGTTVDNMYVFVYGSNGSYNIGVISTDNINSSTIAVAQTGWDGLSVANVVSNGNSCSVAFSFTQITISTDPNNIFVPIYATFEDAIDAFLDNVNNGEGETVNANIAVAPKEKIREQGSFYIPDISETDYVPEAITLTSNLIYDDTDDKDSLLEKIYTQLMANTDVLDLTNTLSPSPVISPYIPFDFPSFNFNFSGIWHYVVSWIGSIRSGSTFIFSVWNNIPYSMTIPIYATAVVCIVVGIFRKVF